MAYDKDDFASDRDTPKRCHCGCAHCNSRNHGRCSFSCHAELECSECGEVDCICGKLADEEFDTTDYAPIDDSPAAVERRALLAFRAQIADKKTWRNA